MLQKLLDLHEIQKIDLEIRAVQQEGESFEDRLTGLKDGILKARAKVEELTTQRDTLIREAKILEGTVQAETVKIRKWEARLNEIRNQREYLALSREVEASKRANRSAEEKILELMGQQEEIDKQLDERQDKLAEEEVDYVSAKEEVAQEMKDTQARVDASTKRREVLLPGLPKALLNKYEFVRQRRLGIGLVSVVEGSCLGCNMRLPPQLYNVLQRGDSIEQCPACQRIVIWDEFLHQDKGEEKAEETVEASP